MLTMIDSFIAWKTAGNLAPGTLRVRRNHLTAFNRVSPLDQAQHGDIVTYLSNPRRGPAASKSILTTLRTFYRWANATGCITHDPTLLVHPVKQHHRIPRPTPLAAVASGLSTCDRDITAMVMLGYRAGLRLSEIASLHSDDVAPHSLWITGKGGRQRMIPIHRDLRPHVASFTGWRFPSPLDPTRHVFADYVADRVSAATGHRTHGLRHRFATDVYAKTRDLRTLQMLLGHSSIQTTSRYVQVSDTVLTEAIAALH